MGFNHHYSCQHCLIALCHIHCKASISSAKTKTGILNDWMEKLVFPTCSSINWSYYSCIASSLKRGTRLVATLALAVSYWQDLAIFRVWFVVMAWDFRRVTEKDNTGTRIWIKVVVIETGSSRMRDWGSWLLSVISSVQDFQLKDTHLQMTTKVLINFQWFFKVLIDNKYMLLWKIKCLGHI